jgi:cytochrome c2
MIRLVLQAAAQPWAHRLGDRQERVQKLARGLNMAFLQCDACHQIPPQGQDRFGMQIMLIIEVAER